MTQIINRIRKLLGLCEHDFHPITWSKHHFMSCTKCGRIVSAEGHK